MANSSSSSKMKGKLVYKDGRPDKEDKGVVELGFSLERLKLCPRKKLLIMGLGGLLCHRGYCFGPSKIPAHRPPDALCGNFFVYQRPHCKEFIKFCLDRFVVGIWSSAREWNVNDTLDVIMAGLKSKLLFFWDQEECTETEFADKVDVGKPIFLKELKKLWGQEAAKLLRLSRVFSPSNTLLIDNESYKALLNPPNTAIFLTEYKADLDDKVLGAGSELRLYLDKVAIAEDIPSFIEKYPFGTPSITPQHPDWEFYSKIIDKYHN